MMLRWLLASLHLLALPLGLGAIVIRSRALRLARTVADLPRVFMVDTLWGLAAILWISTGLARAFGGFEKGTDYYVNDRAFSVKMALLAAILLLEVWPMMTLIRWRISVRRGTPVDLGSAGTLARISAAQAVATVLMVFAAAAVARGFLY